MPDSTMHPPSCADLDALAAERLHCAPLACTLSALSCARRVVSAHRPRLWMAGAKDQQAMLTESPCRTCAIGAANRVRAGL